MLRFSVGSAGELTPLPAVTLSSIPDPVNITLSPSGRTAYVLSTCIDANCVGQVAQYAGQHFYALSSNSIGASAGSPQGGHIDQYSIGAAGLLTTISTIPVNTGYPTAMATVTSHSPPCETAPPASPGTRLRAVVRRFPVRPPPPPQASRRISSRLSCLTWGRKRRLRCDVVLSEFDELAGFLGQGRPQSTSEAIAYRKASHGRVRNHDDVM